MVALPLSYLTSSRYRASDVGLCLWAVGPAYPKCSAKHTLRVARYHTEDVLPCHLCGREAIDCKVLQSACCLYAAAFCSLHRCALIVLHRLVHVHRLVYNSSCLGYGYVPAPGTPDAAPASDPLAGPAVVGAERSAASKAQVVGGFGSIREYRNSRAVYRVVYGLYALYHDLPPSLPNTSGLSD